MGWSGEGGSWPWEKDRKVDPAQGASHSVSVSVSFYFYYIKNIHPIQLQRKPSKQVNIHMMMIVNLHL